MLIKTLENEDQYLLNAFANSSYDFLIAFSFL